MLTSFSAAASCGGRPFRVQIENVSSPRGEEWHIVATFVRCVSPSGEVRLSSDHDAFEWIDPAQDENYPLASNIREAFAAYRKRNF